MATRKIKEAKDLSSNELIYFKGHAKATYTSDGATVEDKLNKMVTTETVSEVDSISDYILMKKDIVQELGDSENKIMS